MANFSTTISGNDVKFDFVFQPIVNQESLKVIGFECLSNVDISLSNMSKEHLFESMPKNSLKKLIEIQLSELDKLESCDMFFSINIPASLVIDKEFFGRIIQGVTYKLAFEITDFDISKSQFPLLKKQIEKYQESLSLSFWLDDFIPNNMFIDICHSIPWDVIKFDKSVINDLTQFNKALSIFNSIKKDNTTGIIVEGIEDNHQHLTLNGLGTLAQGFLYGRPKNIRSYI
jgi:EAL domain-containing protein (putative c-di-GMP-specific phosphodiesterase class I)